MNKHEAVQVLSDEIADIERYLNNLSYISQEIVEEFFAKYNHAFPQPQDEQLSILWEFSRYAAFADIMREYIFKIENVMESLTPYFGKKEASPCE